MGWFSATSNGAFYNTSVNANGYFGAGSNFGSFWVGLSPNRINQAYGKSLTVQAASLRTFIIVRT